MLGQDKFLMPRSDVALLGGLAIKGETQDGKTESLKFIAT